MVLKELGNFQRIDRVLALAQWQGFQSLDELERVEWAQGSAQIAQQCNADLQDERHVAQSGHVIQGVPVNQPMITGIGLSELRKRNSLACFSSFLTRFLTLVG